MSRRSDTIRTTLAEELRAAAREAPDRTFLRMMNGRWTFRDIDEASDRFAARLAKLGAGKGDVVSAMLDNGQEFLVAWFATAKLGAVLAPVNTSFRGAGLRAALELAGARLIVAHAHLREGWEPVVAQLPALEHAIVVGGDLRDGDLAFDDLASGGDIAPAPAPVAFSDLSLLLYTSGTTGASKAAMISHRFVLAQAACVIEGLGLTPDDVLYCPYPLYHLDAAVMTVAPALLMRATAAIGERFSVSRFWDEMRALEATVFDFMGATLTMLHKQPPSPHDRAHKARLGWGVPLPDWAPEFEARFGCRLVELYGSTEVGVPIYTPLDEPRRPGACGRPLDRFEVRIVDADGFEVAPGEPGELLVRGREPSLIMDGYYRNPEATLTAFKDLWFHTGDILKRDADGYLYFVGRVKDMVRRRGENISAAEVELGLETHPDVLECAVFGVPSEMTEEEVMACVVARPGSGLDASTLADHCRARMARFMVPRYVRFMDALPKTPTDKVEKFRLKAAGITPDTVDLDATAGARAKPAGT